jgi:hypothetical protein
MTTPKQISLVEQRERLERRANVVRSRLLRTIDALDTRRHQIAEISGHVKRLAVPTVATVIGIAVATATAAFAITRIVRVRRERHLSYRLGKMLSPMFQQKRPSILEDAARKVTLTVLGIVATELAKRTTKNVLDGRMPEGQRLLPRGAT